MKSEQNINSIEYASIGLSAIGTVAAVITQQIAYIATPLTLSLSLSLINRQKELDRATKRLANLEQQSQTIRDYVNALSSAPAPINFENLQQNISDNRQKLKRIETVIFELEKRDNDLSPFLTEIDLTKDSIKQLRLNFSNFQKQFNDSQVSIRVASKDRSTEEVTGNLNNHISADFSDIEIIDNTPLLEDRLSKSRKIDRSTIYSSIEELKLKVQSLEESSIVAKESIEQIGWRFLDLEKAFDERQDPIEIANIHRSLSKIGNNISNIVDAVVADEKIGELIQQEVERSNRVQFEIVKQLLPKQYSYDLVSGRDESRQIFLESLSQSQQRLILVCPWLTNYAIDNDVRNLLIATLNRGVSIDIGWGHLSDVKNNIVPLSKEILLNSKAKKWGGYSAVKWIYELQDEYKNLLNLKILGTHEKFLVCDRKFAMLGSHNYLTSGDSSTERELGVKTDSPETIDKLIELFDRVGLQ